MDPAVEIFGGAVPVMVTLETELAHGGFEIVHAKTFAPTPKLVIADVGDNEFVIVPEPETRVHAPVPTITALAPIVAPEVTQTV